MPTINNAVISPGAGNILSSVKGNEGRKIVRLTDGTLIASVARRTDAGSPTDYRLYKSVNNGLTWTDFSTRTHVAPAANEGHALATDGTYVYFAYVYAQSEISLRVLTAQGTAHANHVIDSNTLGEGISVAVSPDNTAIHVAYVANLNGKTRLRYRKGTISGGNITWQSPKTASPDTWTSVKRPSITVDEFGNPHVAYEAYTSSTNQYHIHVESSRDGGNSLVYGYILGATPGYPQRNPNVVYSAREKAVYVAYDSLSGDNLTRPQIRLGKILTGSDTQPEWSQTLATGITPSITVDKNGKMFILFEDDAQIKHVSSTNYRTWNAPVYIGAGTSPNALLDARLTNLSPPVFVYTSGTGITSVSANGSWKVITISVAPRDIGTFTSDTKNRMLTYTLTAEAGETLPQVQELINDVVSNTRTAASGTNYTVNATDIAWNGAMYGQYRDGDGSRNVLTITVGDERWEYPFEKQLSTNAKDADIVKSVADMRNYMIPSIKAILTRERAGVTKDNSLDEIVHALGQRKIKGTSVSSASQFNFLNTDGTAVSYYRLTGSLPFRPSLLIARGISGNIIYTAIYSNVPDQYYGQTVKTTAHDYSHWNTTGHNMRADAGAASITASSFSIPVYNSNLTYNWEAYE